MGPRRKIAFNTANLVARVSGYRFHLDDWGRQHARTVEQTDAHAFASICHEIKACGYDAIELWVAHCDPSAVSRDGVRERKRIARDAGLHVMGVAGIYTRQTLDVAEAFGCESINGGLWGTDLKAVRSLVRSSNVAYNYENHAEQTAEQILSKIDGGDERIGVALDTGWIGTSMTEDAPTVCRRLGPLIRHVHVKDVATRGKHDTCPIGTGIVDLEGAIRALKDLGYSGWYSWEDEPEDRNPLDIAAQSLRWIEQRV